MSRRPPSPSIRVPEVLQLRTYEDCYRYADRFLAKAHHDVVLDAFMALRKEVSDAYRCMAAEFRAARPSPVGTESEADLEEMRARWHDLTKKALACDRHAGLLEERHAEDFERDYLAVMTEAEGLDPLDVAPSFIDAARWEVRQ